MGAPPEATRRLPPEPEPEPVQRELRVTKEPEPGPEGEAEADVADAGVTPSADWELDDDPASYSAPI